MEPVIITYTHPQERVLFNRARDANPFFHLYEAIWMLAGRNDVAPLAYFNSKIADIASDDGKTFNGAYGHRWRHHRSDISSDPLNIALTHAPHWTKETDQLGLIIEHLKKNPRSRRVVLQMWNVEDDLLNVDTTKDCCCNTHVYFALRQVISQDFTKADDEDGQFNCYDVLDMTVCNRSNDMIWGMLGANVVHFSILQEYIAACLGVKVGVYNQFTNNLHVYRNNWHPNLWDEDDTPDYYLADSGIKHYPLVKDPAIFDKECKAFIEVDVPRCCTRNWCEPFLQEVLSPAVWAFHQHKKRRYTLALEATDLIKADDWRIACRHWILNRKTRYELSQRGESSDES
jgi:thymidylate synthase